MGIQRKRPLIYEAFSIADPLVSQRIGHKRGPQRFRAGWLRHQARIRTFLMTA